MTALAVDRDQLERFIRIIFRNVGEGDTVSLRNFYDDEAAKKGGDKPQRIRNVTLNGAGVDPVIPAAVETAEEAARASRPVVMAPPICTFNGNKADAASVREAPVITVEIDAHPRQGLQALRGALGPPTLLVESGGEWTDPDTGEIEPKLHVHYLLSEPAATPEEHAKLRRARELACNLAAGDPSSIPQNHPIRWAGTVHRKNPDAPRRCRIVEANPHVEIALEHALDELEGLAALREWTLGQRPRAVGNAPGGGGDDDLLAAIAEVLTNPLPPKRPGSAGQDGQPRGGWDDWNTVGLRFYAASGGSEAGFDAFDAFSCKNTKKYDAEATRARWEHFRTSPPTRTGVGALVVEARRCDPTFRARRPERPEATREQARDTGDAADWHSLLLSNGKSPLGCEANVEIALRHAPELAGRLRFNELTDTAECSAPPWRPRGDWRAWTDNDDTALAVFCQRSGIKVKPSACAAAVQLVAADHPHHPVRRYLDGLRWDGTPRLDSWLYTYLGVRMEEAAEGDGENERQAAKARNAYVRQVGRKWLISAVARAYKPGCKADHVLNLEGPQGVGKSSALAALAPDPDWFADDIGDLGSKDSAQDLRGKWLIELAELSSMRRPEVERTKAFISRPVDHYRPSYGRRSQDFPRQCVFAGTTNADAYLQDDTNRRFWPVKVGTIKLAELRAARDQLWAEAVLAFKAGENWWLDAQVEKAARAEQAERRVSDPWEEELLAWAKRQKTPFTIGEVLAGAVKVPVEKQDRAAEMRAATTLKANGWERFRRREGERLRWLYRKASPPQPNGGVPNPGGSPGEVGNNGRRSEEVGNSEPRSDAAQEVGNSPEKAAGLGTVGNVKALSGQGCSQRSQPFQQTQEGRTSGEGTGAHTANGNRLGTWERWEHAESAESAEVEF